MALREAPFNRPQVIPGLVAPPGLRINPTRHNPLSLADPMGTGQAPPSHGLWPSLGSEVQPNSFANMQQQIYSGTLPPGRQHTGHRHPPTQSSLPPPYPPPQHPDRSMLPSLHSGQQYGIYPQGGLHYQSWGHPSQPGQPSSTNLPPGPSPSTLLYPLPFSPEYTLPGLRNYGAR